MLAPGNYDILFTCEGYTDKSFKVDLAQKQLIDLDVSLVPVGYPPEEPEVPEYRKSRYIMRIPNKKVFWHYSQTQ